MSIKGKFRISNSTNFVVVGWYTYRTTFLANCCAIIRGCGLFPGKAIRGDLKGIIERLSKEFSRVVTVEKMRWELETVRRNLKRMEKERQRNVRPSQIAHSLPMLWWATEVISKQIVDDKDKLAETADFMGFNETDKRRGFALIDKLSEETTNLTINDSDSDVEGEFEPTDMTDRTGATNMNQSIPTTPSTCETPSTYETSRTYDPVWASTLAAAARVKKNRRRKVGPLAMDIIKEALKKVLENLILHDKIVHIYFDDSSPTDEHFFDELSEEGRVEENLQLADDINLDVKAIVCERNMCNIWRSGE
uniref:Uncharacterized protein n=1 Tax=Glossina palpalis gambiensis TaxID=67801 RepID=A0A1B0C112_9MUSC